MQEVLYGSLTDVRISKDLVHTSSDFFVAFNGVIKYLRSIMENDDSASGQKWADQFLATAVCPECQGQRLNRESLSYRIWDKNISELAQMDISELKEWLSKVEEHMEPQQQKIAEEILKEIRTRLDFMLEVGLDYLSLDRQSASLSGGESQRIRLATQIGSQLVNVLYILDEPSIGLHQRDNERLIASLKELRDIGNTVIVVEHDKDMMRSADYIVDIGPKAGRKGGEVVFQGTPAEMMKTDTLTAQYLNGQKEIALPDKRRKGNGKVITLHGAAGNNLKHVDVTFPLGTLIVVTGVSGSGKSTLINETLQPILSQHFYRSLKKPMKYDSIEGLEHIDKVVNVDQTPIGRTPRSNPATYTGVFSDIRSLFVNLPEAKIRGKRLYLALFMVMLCSMTYAQFHTNGDGTTYTLKSLSEIEESGVEYIYSPNSICPHIYHLQKNIVIDAGDKFVMEDDVRVEFFENVPDILRKIKTIQDVGLGYIKLGQPSTTLSGGESQRVKLATELSKKDTGKTLYILDEPTTGLHFEDIRILMNVLQQLVDRGNTVIIIEHNFDVIKLADYIIDMGPEGGRKGGTILTTGTPEEVAKSRKGFTPRFLREEIKK